MVSTTNPYDKHTKSVAKQKEANSLHYGAFGMHLTHSMASAQA